MLKSRRTRARLRQVINSYDKMERILSATDQIDAKRTKVVIIGAGIAGLAAAKAFEDANFRDYLLIEAQKEVGGRILSIPWGKGWIECGAQFVHGNRSQLAELCYEHDLLSDAHYRDGEGDFIRDDGITLDPAVVAEVDDLVRSVLEECEDYENQDLGTKYENIGRVLEARFRQYLLETNDPPEIKDMKEEIYDWNVRFLMIDNSCFTLDELSAKYWGKFKFVGGPEHICFKGGYNALTKILVDSLNEKNLYLNTAVDRIEWHHADNGHDVAEPIILTLSDHSQVIADCVIVTCSLGFLKENHRKMFIPPLPESLREGIEHLGFGVINKVFLDFGKAWWKKDAKGFQLIWKKNDQKAYCSKALADWTRDLQGFDILPNHEGVLLGWVGGRGAYIIEDLTEQEIATDCENLLRHYLNLDNIPPVKRCLRTQWNSSKYVRGSYSHIPARCDARQITPVVLAQPVWGKLTCNNYTKDVPIIMLAGEATHENYYSTTHGAYDTGVKQAQTFLRHHSAQS